MFAIGIDLGATKIAAALVNQEGEILADRTVPTMPERGETAVMADIARLVHDMQTAAASRQGKVMGVGVGSPGQVDQNAGNISNAVNLGWQKVQFVENLHALLKEDIPIWVQKDANAAALGEYYFGAARGIRDFLYITIGSGLGGSAVSAGRVVLGAYGNAAEVGHISLDPQSERMCVCGQRGCAETIISGPGLQLLVREMLAGSQHSSRLTGESSSAEILDAARKDDEIANAAIRMMAQYLGVLLSHAVTWFNPSLIVLGGGLGLAAYDLIVPDCLAEARKRVYRANMDFRVLPSSVKSSAVGAASLVWYSLNGANDHSS